MNRYNDIYSTRAEFIMLSAIVGKEDSVKQSLSNMKDDEVVQFELLCRELATLSMDETTWRCQLTGRKRNG